MSSALGDDKIYHWILTVALTPGLKGEDCVIWKPSVVYSEIPENAIIGGHYRGERLYVCRGPYMYGIYYPGMD